MKLEQILLDDQKRIRGLFRQVQVLEQRAPEMISGVSGELFLDLELHARAELEHVFPQLLSDLNDSSIAGDLGQAREAQLDVMREVEALKALNPGAEDWPRRMGDFRRTIDLHFDHELRQVFPLIRHFRSDLSSQLADRILEERQRTLGRPERSPMRPEVVQNPHGGEQKRKVG